MAAHRGVVITAVMIAPADAEDQDGYTYAPSSHFSTGTFFMGREIANVVNVQAAEWFDRERRAEEGTEALIPLLGLKPTDVIADIDAGTGYFSFRLSRAFPNSKICAEDIQPEMLDIIAKQKSAGEGTM